MHVKTFLHLQLIRLWKTETLTLYYYSLFLSYCKLLFFTKFYFKRFFHVFFSRHVLITFKIETKHQQQTQETPENC